MSQPMLLTGSEGMTLELTLKADYERALLEMLLRKRLKQLRMQNHQPAKKQCPICQKMLRNSQRTFCSNECVCKYMTLLASSPDYYAKREQRQQARLVEIHCKICHKNLGLRKPGSVTYCSRECVGRDSDIRASKAAKRRQLWADPEYRQQRSKEALTRNADPGNGFGKNQ